MRLASVAMMVAALMCLGTFIIAASSSPRSLKRDRIFVVGMGVSLVLLTTGRRTRSGID
jgi:multisubunit Na+/H+ antiporter MnhC subunit